FARSWPGSKAWPSRSSSARPDALAGQSLAVVGAVQCQLRSLGNDAVGVDVAMACVVMAFDVGEIDGFGDARPLVELAQPVRQVRIILDPPQVALEVAVIDGVEADHGGEEPPVSFGEKFAGQVTPLRQAPFQPVQFVEELVEGRFVGFLRGGEAGTVDTVVDPGVNPRVEAVDFRA